MKSQQQPSRRSVSELVALLKECGRTKDLPRGKKIHLEAVAAGCQINRYVAVSLISMYNKCGSMTEARAVFDRLPHRNVVTWTSLMLGYVNNGESLTALELFANMDCEPDSITFVAALKACAALPARKQLDKSSSLRRGKLIHDLVKKRELESELVVGNALLDMYSKCGSISEARTVFDRMPQKNVVSWTCLILGYVDNGESETALTLFAGMDCQPDSATYVSVLKACGALRSLEKGRAIHIEATERHFDSGVVVTNTLVDMYSKCGDMHSARYVFESSVSRNDVTWTCLINGYVENGQSQVAMEVFECMDCQPNAVTFMAALKAYASLACEEKTMERKELWLDKGVGVYERAKSHGFHSNKLILNTLVDMYGKCGSMRRAQEVFNQLTLPDTVSWNCLIMGYVNNGDCSRAFDNFTSMSSQPDSVTFVAALRSCAGSSFPDKLEKGMELHQRLKALGLESDTVVTNTLVDMYSKCGCMAKARDVFLSITSRSVVSWNCLIHGYVENGESIVALEVFANMDCEPDQVTFVGAVKACASLASRSEPEFSLRKGRLLHRLIMHRGFHTDVKLANGLLGMYGKYGSPEDASQVFTNMSSTRNVVSWNSFILAHAECGRSTQALEIFTRMDCQPDCATFVAAVKACAALASEKPSAALDHGLEIDKRIKHLGFEDNLLVANTLLDMYCKCGSVSRAQLVFDNVVKRSSVTWNSLIMGYVEDGQSSVALGLYTAIDCQPDLVTFTAALKACGNLGAQSAGQDVHARVCRHGLEQSGLVASSLINFYCKCGNPSAAELVFYSLHSPTIVSWNALLAGYTLLGDSNKVFALVGRLQVTGLQVNEVTLLCVLTACSHAGMVDEGRVFFTSMLSRYGLSPRLEHYTCIVDMLGRADRLHEALSILKDMPLKADVVTWTSLLGACHKWNDRSVGKLAFDSLQHTDRKETAAYVLMGGILSRESR